MSRQINPEALEAFVSLGTASKVQQKALNQVFKVLPSGTAPEPLNLAKRTRVDGQLAAPLTREQLQSNIVQGMKAAVKLAQNGYISFTHSFTSGMANFLNLSNTVGELASQGLLDANAISEEDVHALLYGASQDPLLTQAVLARVVNDDKVAQFLTANLQERSKQLEVIQSTLGGQFEDEAAITEANSLYASPSIATIKQAQQVLGLAGKEKGNERYRALKLMTGIYSPGGTYRDTPVWQRADRLVRGQSANIGNLFGSQELADSKLTLDDFYSPELADRVFSRVGEAEGVTPRQYVADVMDKFKSAQADAEAETDKEGFKHYASETMKLSDLDIVGVNERYAAENGRDMRMMTELMTNEMFDSTADFNNLRNLYNTRALGFPGSKGAEKSLLMKTAISQLPIGFMSPSGNESSFLNFTGALLPALEATPDTQSKQNQFYTQLTQLSNDVTSGSGNRQMRMVTPYMVSKVSERLGLSEEEAMTYLGIKPDSSLAAVYKARLREAKLRIAMSPQENLALSGGYIDKLNKNEKGEPLPLQLPDNIADFDKIEVHDRSIDTLIAPVGRRNKKQTQDSLKVENTIIALLYESQYSQVSGESEQDQSDKVASARKGLEERAGDRLISVELPRLNAIVSAYKAEEAAIKRDEAALKDQGDASPEAVQAITARKAEVQKMKKAADGELRKAIETQVSSVAGAEHGIAYDAEKVLTQLNRLAKEIQVRGSIWQRDVVPLAKQIIGFGEGDLGTGDLEQQLEQVAFSLVPGRRMAKKGEAAAEHSEGSVLVRTNLTGFSAKGTSEGYKKVWEPVHEILGHHFLDTLNNLNKTSAGQAILRKQWVNTKRLDRLLGTGATEAMFNKDGEVIDGSMFKDGLYSMDQSGKGYYGFAHAGDGTWNELLATMLPFYFLSQSDHYKNSQDQSLVGPILGQLAAGREYNLAMFKDISFEEMKGAVEASKPNLRLRGVLDEATKSSYQKKISALQSSIGEAEVELEYLSEDELNAANRNEGVYSPGTLANYSEKEQGARIFISGDKTRGSKIYLNKQQTVRGYINNLMALFHDGNHALTEKKETASPEYMKNKLAELRGLVAEVNDPELTKTFENLMDRYQAKGDEKYDHPVEDLILTVNDSKRPDVTMATVKTELANVKDRVIVSRQFDETAQTTQDFIAQVDQLLGQDEVTMADLENLAKMPLAKTEFGAGIELLGHVSPFSYIPQEAAQFHAGDKDLLGFVTKVYSTPALSQFFAQHNLEIGLPAQLQDGTMVALKGSGEQVAKLNQIVSQPDIKLGGIDTIEVVSGSETSLVSQDNGVLKINAAALNNPVLGEIATDLALTGNRSPVQLTNDIVAKLKEHGGQENAEALGVDELDQVVAILKSEDGELMARQPVAQIVSNYMSTRPSSSPISKSQPAALARASSTQDTASAQSSPISLFGGKKESAPAVSAPRTKFVYPLSEIEQVFQGDVRKFTKPIEFGAYLFASDPTGKFGSILIPKTLGLDDIKGLNKNVYGWTRTLPAIRKINGGDKYQFGLQVYSVPIIPELEQAQSNEIFVSGQDIILAKDISMAQFFSGQRLGQMFPGRDMASISNEELAQKVIETIRDQRSSEQFGITNGHVNGMTNNLYMDEPLSVETFATPRHVFPTAQFLYKVAMMNQQAQNQLGFAHVHNSFTKAEKSSDTFDGVYARALEKYAGPESQSLTLLSPADVLWLLKSQERFDKVLTSEGNGGSKAKLGSRVTLSGVLAFDINTRALLGQRWFDVTKVEKDKGTFVDFIKTSTRANKTLRFDENPDFAGAVNDYWQMMLEMSTEGPLKPSSPIRGQTRQRERLWQLCGAGSLRRVHL